MADQRTSETGTLIDRLWRRFGWVIFAAVLVAALAPVAPGLIETATGVRPHGPDGALWAAQPLVIQAHVAAAVSAFAIGLVILFRAKGTGFHRTFGWAWVLAMAATAITSLFITELNGDFYSLIHLLSGWTLVALPMGVYAIRRRRSVNWHRRTMIGIFVGGMVIAGGFSFLPERLMWRLFFG